MFNFNLTAGRILTFSPVQGWGDFHDFCARFVGYWKTFLQYKLLKSRENTNDEVLIGIFLSKIMEFTFWRFL